MSSSRSRSGLRPLQRVVTSRWDAHCLARLVALLSVLFILVSPLAGWVTPQPAGANHTNIKLPFVAGSSWYISQGYNTSAAQGGSHYNCGDAASGSQSCSQYWQYKYSLDFARPGGGTAGQTVLSPVNGTIRWIDLAYGGMSINLGDNYAVAFFHADLAPGLAAGQTVRQGQYLGTVAGPGGGGNGGWPHIHFTIWSTTDGGNWSRIAVPFTDEHSLEGVDFPASGDSNRNQHQGRQLTSSNVQITEVQTPGVPTLSSPPTGTTYQTSPAQPTLSWQAVAGATEYQVVINDGAMNSPWVSSTSWTTPQLGDGQYAWQVRARNSAGTSNLSPKWVFWVDPPPTDPPPPGPGDGELEVRLNTTAGNVGAGVTATGSGMGANETVRIYWDTQSSTAIASTTANGSGAFSVAFNVPEATGGNHTVIARGASTTRRTTATFRVNPALVRAPYQGPPGTPIDVTVRGFGGNETVRLTFISATGPVLGTTTTNARGTGTLRITMPEAASGWRDYTGVGLTSGLRAWGALLVQPIVTVSPTSGAPNATINLNAKGFPASRGVTAAWNKNTTNPGANVCSGTTNSSGNYSCSFRIPQSGAGSFPVVVTATDNTFASATVGVSGATAITVAPTSGRVGTDLTVNAGGFSAIEMVNFTWDSSSTVWQSQRADANGALLLRTTVPSLSTGAHTLRARGASSGRTVTAPFTVLSGAPTGDTSMIGPGTYAVTGTREGLVGGTTSNGHVIVPNDHFVALPACTASSCPWAMPGSIHPDLGRITDCGDNCYVRVTNPATDRCEVAPIWDVGPWFTNDNWWETVDRRNLNNLDSTVNILAQGYTGADAAMNGLDVGYGVSGRGRGISNKAYEVGNRAAIDIADGTWVDIGFAYGDGIGQVVVTLLWQTGEDHNAAARVCDGEDPPPTGDDARISISPLTGPPGTEIDVSGTGFRPNERVGVYWNSTYSTPLVTVTANSSGAFTTTIETPDDDEGRHLVAAKGQTSGWKASRSYTLEEPPPPAPDPDEEESRISIAPSSGPAGTTVSVTGAGFQPGESVKVSWDSSFAPALTTVRASSTGTFAASIRVPNDEDGRHLIVAKGLTSDWKASRTFTLGPFSATDDTRVSIDPLSGPVGTTIAITGTDFLPGETVRLHWDSTFSAEITAVTADGNGAFSGSIQVPEDTASRHLVVGMGETTGWKASRGYTLVPSLTSQPDGADAGATVDVDAQGFGASETIEIRWGDEDGDVVGSLTTDSRGSGTGEFQIPTGAAFGPASFVAVGTSSDVSATGTVVVTSAEPTISLAPTVGFSGDRVTITAAGYGPNEWVRVFWDDRTSYTSSGRTDAFGMATFSAAIPTMPSGDHTITLRGDDSDGSAAAPFRIDPAITLTPDSGPLGTRVSVAGKSWTPGASVTLYWLRAGSETGPVVCTGSPSSTGSFWCSFDVPSGSSGESFSVSAVSGQLSASADFTIGSFSAQTALASDGTDVPTPDTSPPADPVTPTPEPTETPTDTPTPDDTPVEEPSTTPEPTESPTETPTETPTTEPSEEPTREPTPTPTDAPTEVPTEEPTGVPTEVPTPTPTPEPVPREVVAYAVSDASVSAVAPDDVQPPDQIGSLPAGGADGAVAFVTFQVEGIAAGTVINAQLILTPVGDVGAPGGVVGVIPGYWADEASLTYNTAPVAGNAPALRADGSAAAIDWAEPWVEVAIDVSGTVTADGLVTFVVSGAPDQVIALASRESGAPARLVITVIDQ
ncbi:MAG: M23 family metallopeptidase [Thermomicrobiales bacterium]